MKIKVFKFPVYMMGELRHQEVSEDEIANTVNEFCEDHEVVSISTDTISIPANTNGLVGEIDMIYTILYKER